MLRAALQRVSIVAVLLVLTGCAGISRSGPAEMAISQGSADLAGFSLVDMNPRNVGDYLVRHVGDGAGTAGIPSPPPVVLSSGDIIKVRISESKEGGLFAPLAAGGTVFDKVRVDHRGTISLPYAAGVKVAGLDTQAVEERIRAKLSGVSFEPQVFVELVADGCSSILFGGEVKNPGRFSCFEGC
jgi:polysaccharide export outer membrane protein